jgi:hypothetical protein
MIITGKGGGIFGKGMHKFILDDLELGERVAMYLDHEQCWGSVIALDFLTMEIPE